MMRRILFVIAGIGCLGLGACSQSGSPTSDEMVPVVIDKSNAGELLRFFLGSYIDRDGGNPVAAGVLVTKNDRFYVRPDSLAAVFPPAGTARLDGNGDGTVDWGELEAFLKATYYEARNIPRRLQALRDNLEYRDTTAWFRVDIDGVMTSARRRIYVARSALAAALEGYISAGRRLLYPTGTTIVGEHWSRGRLVEVTGMRKRGDGYWDYFVYDSTGTLTPSTHTEPKQLAVPAQCAGCHFGSRLFEPEESFPARARPGPHGPRRIHVGDDLRRPDLVRMFDEHRKRSDHVLGIYNTLFVARLLRLKEAGALTAKQAQLLAVVNL